MEGELAHHPASLGERQERVGVQQPAGRMLPADERLRAGHCTRGDVALRLGAYPLADLMLLALMLAVFALNGWRPGATWLLVAIGFALNIVADSIYIFQAGAGI